MNLPTCLRFTPFRFLVALGAFAVSAYALNLGRAILTHGSGTSTLTAFAENPDGTLSIEAQQAGQLAHLGRFTGASTYLATIDYNTGTTFITGDCTITAANGDQLFTVVDIIEVGVDYPRPYTGTLKITGGTGRYAGASGLLNLTGIDDESFTDSIAITGSILTAPKTK